MFRIFYAEQDATIYEASPNANAGLDEVLEIGKRLGTDGETLQKSRSVVKFNMTEISESIVDRMMLVNNNSEENIIRTTRRGAQRR